LITRTLDPSTSTIRPTMAINAQMRIMIFPVLHPSCTDGGLR
jgi:hypothetical protein